MTAFKIEFEPIGRRGECPSGKSILDCALTIGIGIASVCGRQGTCNSCKVQILAGQVSAPTSSERNAFSAGELKAGWRLACQTYPLGDCKLHIPVESMTTTQRLQTEGLEVVTRLEPSARAYRVKLSIPSLSDLTADADRLSAELNRQHHVQCQQLDIEIMHQLSPQLRSLDWECQVTIRDNEVIALGPWPSNKLGLAIDLGTTKIAGYLIDLKDGKNLAARGIMNPQISFGEDVVSRILAAVKSKDTADNLQTIVVEALNQLGHDLCSQVNAKPVEIVDIVVVGNTAMHHLFLGLPVEQLSSSPFVPAVSHALDVKTRELGMNTAPGAYLHILPNIAGFVGADHVAMLLAHHRSLSKGVIIALDIGTNTEVSLAKRGKITTVSCASGPAFEGGHIKYGMRAAAGAIERVHIEGEKVLYQTIEGAPPIGICGSGILDAMAQLYVTGIIDESGRMRDGHPNIRSRDNQREFVLVQQDSNSEQQAIVITQQDIRELQLAKAAIRTGIQTLLEANDCSEDDVSQVIVAGAFGTYIDIASAVTIGMLPVIPQEKVLQVGNAAGMGARLALTSLSKRAEAQSLARKIHYLELASAPNFNKTFIQASYLGRYWITDGNRIEIK